MLQTDRQQEKPHKQREVNVRWQGQQTIEPKQIKNNKTNTRPACNLGAEVQLAKVPNVREVALAAHHNPAVDAMIAPPQMHLRAGFVLNTAPGAERERAARNEHDGLGPISVPNSMAGAFAVDLGELEPKALRTAVYPQGSFAQRAGPLTSQIPE